MLTDVKALRDRRSLAKSDVMLKVGNDSIISGVTVGSLNLYLSNGLVLNLKNVYQSPFNFINIISVSCFDAERLPF